MSDLQPKLAACFDALIEPKTFASSRETAVDSFEQNMMAVDQTFGSILDTVRTWLELADIMPSKEEVLAWVEAAFDASRLAGRLILKRILLAAVSLLYDTIIAAI